MQPPYLILGYSTTNASVRLEVAADLQRELAGATNFVDLGDSVFLVQVAVGKEYDSWTQLSRVLEAWDIATGGTLRWFVHLADYRGCHLSAN